MNCNETGRLHTHTHTHTQFNGAGPGPLGCSSRSALPMGGDQYKLLQLVSVYFQHNYFNFFIPTVIK